MKENGLDIDVGADCVLVEENRATCVVGHVEAVREKLAVNIFGSIFVGYEMPPSCNVSRRHLLFSRRGPGFQL